MRYRLDFVTNSSSSSYVCDICGLIESGWDISLSDCSMVDCKNGHTFHEDEALMEIDKDFQEYDEYEVDSKYCPICQLKVVVDRDLKKFMFKYFNASQEKMTKAIQSSFKTYDEFVEYLNKD